MYSRTYKFEHIYPVKHLLNVKPQRSAKRSQSFQINPLSMVKIATGIGAILFILLNVFWLVQGSHDTIGRTRPKSLKTNQFKVNANVDVFN